MGYTPKNFTRNAVRIQKSNVLIQPDDPYRRQFIKFINTLRCPICQAGLDGSISDEANIYCRFNPDEYHAQYKQGTFIPVRDSICFEDWKIDHQQLSGNKYKTTVWYMLESGFSLPQHKFVLEYEGEMLFSATSFNEDEFLNKMELYDVFS